MPFHSQPRKTYIADEEMILLHERLEWLDVSSGRIDKLINRQVALHQNTRGAVASLESVHRLIRHDSGREHKEKKADSKHTRRRLR